MDWSFLLFGFGLAVITGAGVAALLAQNRPGWASRWRLLVSASVLPAITILATAAGIALIASSEHGQGDNMEDLAIAALATIGGGFVLLAFVAGLLGAALTQRRRRG